MDKMLVRSSCSKRLLSIALLVSVSGIFLSCLPPRPSAQCRAFYDLSPQERELKIRTSAIEEQLALYECGMYQEPPTDFAADVAKGGEGIVPIILDKLKTETSETRQDHLIHILEELALKGHLVGRQDVIEQLRSVIPAMKDDYIRKAAQKKLSVIENNL